MERLTDNRQNHHGMPTKNPKTKVTIVDLGKRLKLSPRAVSMVLNGGSANSTVRVNQKTRERVERMAKEVGYRPNRGAQMFRTGKHPGLIGMLSLQGFDPVMAERTYFSQLNAEKKELFLLQYLMADLREDRGQRAVDFFLDAGVESVVVFIPLIKRHILRLLEHGISVLSVGAHQPVEVPSYFPNKVEGFATLTRHMIAQGHSRLAFIQNLENPPLTHGAYAEEGFLLAVAEARAQGKSVTAHIRRSSVPIKGFMSPRYPDIHGIQAPGYAAMKEIIASKDIPEGLICLNDTHAQGAIRACVEAGISLPEEIAIGGFGDEPWSSGGLMTLTSVRQPLDELCDMAFTDLKESLTKKEALPARNIQLHCNLVVRESTKHSRKQ